MNDRNNEGYTVKTLGGCTMVFGQAPILDMVGLMKRAPKKAVMDIGLADRIGATLVFGLKDDLERLPVSELPISPKRLADASAAKAAGLPAVVQGWLTEGDRGMSSNAMCKAIWGGASEGAENHHPLDVDDLSRCIAMIDATQPGNRIQQAAIISPEWAEIMAVWDRLHSTFKRESAEMNEGSRKSFVATAELLQTALAKGSQNSGIRI